MGSGDFVVTRLKIYVQKNTCEAMHFPCLYRSGRGNKKKRGKGNSKRGVEEKRVTFKNAEKLGEALA